MKSINSTLALFYIFLESFAGSVIKVVYLHEDFIVLPHAFNKRSHLVSFNVGFMQVELCPIQLLLLLRESHLRSFQLLLRPATLLEFSFQITRQPHDFISDLL